jgi:translocation and assembly module TamB
MSLRPITRWIWIALATLGLLLGVVIALSALLLYHPGGPAWVLEQIRAHSPLTIEVDSLQGPLAGPLSLRGVRLGSADFALQIDVFDLEWEPAALMGGEFHLVSMAVSGVNLALPAEQPTKAAPSHSGLVALDLPVSLRIDQLSVDRIEVKPQQGDPWQIDRISVMARSQKERMQIESLELVMPALELLTKGEIGLSAPLPTQLDLVWRYRSKDQVTLQGSGVVSGDLKRMRITQSLNGPVSGDMEASVYDLVERIRWDARIHLDPADLSPWLADFPLHAGGDLRTHGTPEQIGLEADLELSQPEYGEASVTFRGSYAKGRLQADRLLIATPAGSRLELSGDYLPDAELGRFEAELAWQDLRWPLQGEQALIESAQGTLKLHGTPSAYDYRLGTELRIPGQPMARLKAGGQGNLQGIRFEELLAFFSPGELRGEGALRWQPAPSWELQFKGSGIDPALWVEALPGELAISGHSRGESGPTGLNAEFQLTQLQGRVRDYPVEAQGQVGLVGDRLRLEAFWLSSGANRIEVAGDLTRQLDLSWRVDGQELKGVWPGLGGNLVGQGRLMGSLEAPRLQADLSSQGLTYDKLRIDELALKSDLAMTGDQRLSLDLRASGLHSVAGEWQRLDLRLSGSLPDHRLNLSLDGGDLPRIVLALEAGWFHARGWQGRLEQLELAPVQQSSWQLVEPADFSLANESQRLARCCLKSAQASLCGETNHHANTGWQAALSGRDFPLTLLQPWLPEGLRIDGRSELEANLSQGAQGRLLGHWRLQIPEGRLGVDLEQKDERIDIVAGELVGAIDQNGASMRWKLPLAELGGMHGEMTLPGVDPLSLDPDSQSLQGELQVRLQDLSRLSLLSPKLLNPRGKVHGAFTLAGTLAQPQLLGSAELEGGALDIPELGLELREIGLQLTAPSHERLTLLGSLRSGKGRVGLQGELELQAQAGFPGHLQMEGNDLTVSNLPEAEVQVSPQLNLAWDPQGTRLKGRIKVPYARLRPRALPESAVSVSPDLVVVGADEKEQRAFDPKLSAELRLELGKRVSFDGFGLRGNLTGSLLVIDEPQRPVMGRGRIGINSGTYRAYGQDLTIERGFALFADSPVDNPGLDVQAVRELEAVTAGVRVGGTLKRPKVDLFSSPSMPEGDILSYLLTGRPPGEGKGESVGIAAALKASGAGTVAEELGRQFGLEELRLDAGSGLEEASVVAGTYLSPRLYIQYINELASRETKVRLRYDINRRLQLEAETGKTQAGDLYYTFDR